jgi:hypothetical protein
MQMNQIPEAIERLNLHVPHMNDAERDSLLQRVYETFQVRPSARLSWDKPDAPYGVQHPTGWVSIADFVGDNNCLLFTEGARTIWVLENGSSLRRIIEECPPVEFFVCDEDVTYLFCFNHHDFVISWGRAKV